jgi:hypothetical protein
MSKAITFISVVIVILILVSSVTEAGHVRRMIVPLQEVAVIAPDRNPAQKSILVNPRLSELGKNTQVLLAVLSVDVDQMEGSGSGSAVQLELIPMTTEWDPGLVSWDYPWDIAGGDVARSHREILFLRDPGIARFDITRLVQRWVDGSLDDYGFVIRVDPRHGSRFDVDLSSNETDGPTSIDLTLILGNIDR